MWTLTADDIRLAKVNALQRRRVIEEHLKSLDAELAELDAIEKSANAFIPKYRSGDSNLAVQKFDVRVAGDAALQLTKNPAAQENLQPKNRNWGEAELTPVSAMGR